MAPFLAAFAGVAIVELWRIAGRQHLAPRLVMVGTVVGLVGWGVAQDLRNELRVFPQSSQAAWIFAMEMADAATFMDTLPPGSRVYFYSDRWSVNYETRQYLAPDVTTEDRSVEFGQFGFEIDPALGDPVFVLLGPYKDLLPELQARYPLGETITGQADGVATFVAYRPPPDTTP
jgi:hypothetical protein